MVEALINPLGFTYVKFYIRTKDTPEMKYLPYKVDTGANNTTINMYALRELGYNDSWVKQGSQLVGQDRPTVATGEAINN